jgi:hypothetical protein
MKLVDLKVDRIENFETRNATTFCKATLANIYVVWRLIAIFGYIPIKAEVAFELASRNFVNFHLFKYLILNLS